jgi:hypothetical protein
MEVAKLVSGGQAGVDRAALDVALELGIPYGGYVPRGGLCEDEIDLLGEYPGLVELPLATYPPRTLKNVQDSTATLLVCPDELFKRSRGTKLTVRYAVAENRPHLQVEGLADLAEVVTWLKAMDGSVTLNVAGPRGSSWEAGYEETRSLLLALLETEEVSS